MPKKIEGYVQKKRADGKRAAFVEYRDGTWPFRYSYEETLVDWCDCDSDYLARKIAEHINSNENAQQVTQAEYYTPTGDLRLCGW